jgi:hypothetical protein
MSEASNAGVEVDMCREPAQLARAAIASGVEPGGPVVLMNCPPYELRNGR